MLDDFERKILAHLQIDGRASVQQLSEAVGLSPSPCWRRVKRLEEAGYINRYAAIVDSRKLGLRAFAYVHISLNDHSEASVRVFTDFVATDPQVIDCASITGDSDYVVKVVARDPERLEQFIMQRILRLGVVRTTTTNFILRQTKTGTPLPVDSAD